MLDGKLNNFYFSEKEEIIMKILWKSDKALSAGEIIDNLSDYKWCTTSTHNLIKKLLEKKAIEVVDIVKIKKTYGRIYQPTISEDDYATALFKIYYDKDNETSSLIATLLGNKKNPELSKSLRELVDKFKED